MSYWPTTPHSVSADPPTGSSPTPTAHAAHGSDTAPFMLGGGSNTLAADTGYPSTVIHMATRGIAVRPLGGDLVEVIAQAGEPLGSLVAFTVTEGLSGHRVPRRDPGHHRSRTGPEHRRLRTADIRHPHPPHRLRLAPRPHPRTASRRLRLRLPHHHVQDPARTIHDPRCQPASGTTNVRLPHPLPAPRRRAGRTPRRPATARRGAQAVLTDRRNRGPSHRRHPPFGKRCRSRPSPEGAVRRSPVSRPCLPSPTPPYRTPAATCSMYVSSGSKPHAARRESTPAGSTGGGVSCPSGP